MKYMYRVLSALIMLQLSIVNVPVGNFGVAYAGENDCPNGEEWSASRNDCVLSESVIDLKVESGQCEGLTGSAYEDCFTAAAQDSTDQIVIDEEEEEGFKKFKNNVGDATGDSNLMKFGMPMIASFSAGWILLKKADQLKSCPSTSMWLLLGGAVAGMGSEIAAQLSYKNQIDNTLERYRERVSATEESEADDYQRSTEAQTAALRALADQEQARINVEGVRQTGYTIAAGLYAAAVVAAIVEAIQQGGGASCYGKDRDGKAIETTSFGPALNQAVPGALLFKDLTLAQGLSLLINKIASNAGISSAHASDGGIWSGAGGLGAIAALIATPAGSSVGEFVSKALGSGVVRGSLATVLGTYSYLLSDQAKRIKENSEKKKTAIEGIIVSYEDTGGSAWNDCTEEQRDNPGVPACYCFNDDGTVNQKRRMRATCFQINSRGGLAAGQYGGDKSSGYVPVKACLQSNGQVDKGCQVCKKRPSACPTMAKANMGSLSLMKGLGMSSLVDDANALATGNLSHSDLNVGDLEKKAANIQKASDKLAKDPKTKNVMKKMREIEDKWNKAAPSLLKSSLQKDPNLLASLGMPAMGPTSAKKEDLLKEAKEKIATKSKPSMSKKTAGANTKKDGASEYDFDFGGGSDGGVEISKDDIMNKEYKVTGDIHKNSNTNLFKILSLRYQRSGLRRLFDSKGRSKADAASETQIHEK